MLLFRTENENGLKVINRSNNISWMDSTKLDEYIAIEIRKQVNGANARNVFSFSRSLAITLFKYNYIGDNPLVLVGYLGDNIILETEDGRLHQISYDIKCLDYPIKKWFPNQKLLLHNFLIAVDNYQDLENYLKYYTGVGRKKVAAVEKDFEVITYDLDRCVGVFEFIDAVYILYALQVRYNFLRCYEAKQYLIKIFNEIPNSVLEKTALCIIMEYLSSNWKYEKAISQQILKEKIKEGRPVPVYDSYAIACEILSKEIPIDQICGVAFDFPMDKVTAAIWEAFGIFVGKVLNI